MNERGEAMLRDLRDTFRKCCGLPETAQPLSDKEKIAIFVITYSWYHQNHNPRLSVIAEHYRLYREESELPDHLIQACESNLRPAMMKSIRRNKNWLKNFREVSVKSPEDSSAPAEATAPQ